MPVPESHSARRICLRNCVSLGSRRVIVAVCGAMSADLTQQRYSASWPTSLELKVAGSSVSISLKRRAELEKASSIQRLL